jgi:hypothetical protein
MGKFQQRLQKFFLLKFTTQLLDVFCLSSQSGFLFERKKFNNCLVDTVDK